MKIINSSTPSPLCPTAPQSIPPRLLTTIKYDPCSVCGLVVQDSDYAVQCDKCKLWVHIGCNKITQKAYSSWNSSKHFECKKCNECKLCDSVEAKNHKVIEWNLCSRWVHIKCNRLGDKDYTAYIADPSKHFFCIDCCNFIFPFNSLTNMQQQLTSKGIEYPEDLDVRDVLKNEYDQNHQQGKQCNITSE